MERFRIALANLRFPATREESVILAERAIADGFRGGREPGRFSGVLLLIADLDLAAATGLLASRVEEYRDA